jgi:hypothetical protein
MVELSQEYEPRTFWQIIWDAVRNAFIQLVYEIIDGIAVILKQIAYDITYSRNPTQYEVGLLSPAVRLHRMSSF